MGFTIDHTLNSITTLDGNAGLILENDNSLRLNSGNTTMLRLDASTNHLVIGETWTLPVSGGAEGQTLVLDASGNANWTTVSAGHLIDDPNPTLSANFDTAGFNINASTGSLNINTLENSLNLSSNTSMTLYSIGAMTLYSDGPFMIRYNLGSNSLFTQDDEFHVEGKFFIQNIAYPEDTGTAGQVLVTNGTNAASWQTISSGGVSEDDALFLAMLF